MNLDLNSILSNDQLLVAGIMAAVLIFIAMLIAMVRRRRWGAVTVLVLTGFGFWWLFLWLGIVVLILPFVLLGGFLDGIQWRMKSGRRPTTVYTAEEFRTYSSPIYSQNFSNQRGGATNCGDATNCDSDRVERVESASVEEETPWDILRAAEEILRKTPESPKPVHRPAPPAKLISPASITPPVVRQAEPKQSPLYWDD